MTSSFHVHRRTFLWLLMGVLLFALVIRLPFLELSRFEHEQVRDLVLSEQILHGDFIWHGFSAKLGEQSLQQSFGPFFYYLLAFALLFVSDPSYYPLASSVLAMVLSVLAVFFCYLFCRRFFSERVALIASLLFSLAPWYVLHASTYLSNGTMMPFFVMLYFYFFSRVIVEKKDGYLIPAAVVLALQTQIHLSSLLLFPVSLVFLILYRRDLFLKRPFFVAVGAALVTYVPYVVHTLSRGSFHDAFAFLAARYPSTYLRTFVESLAIPFMFVTPYLGSYLLGNTPIYPSRSVEILFWIFIVVMVALLFVAFLCAVWRFLMAKDSEKKVLGLLLGWLCLPLLFSILSGTNISPHYLQIVYPVPFILLALLFDFLWERYHPIIVSLVVVIPVLYLVFLGVFYTAVDREGGTTGIYGVPLKYRLQVVDSILQDAGSSPEIVYYGSQKRNFNYLFEIHGMTPEITVINSTAEFTHGYLIFDDFDFYAHTDRAMPEEEKEQLRAMDGMKIKHITIVKK